MPSCRWSGRSTRTRRSSTRWPSSRQDDLLDGERGDTHIPLIPDSRPPQEMVDSSEQVATRILAAGPGDAFTVFLRLLQRPDLFTQNKAAKLLAIVLDARQG